MSGIAPRARLAVYKICWEATVTAQTGCYTADTLKAIDDAVADGVDVINFSVSGTQTNFVDPVEIAYLNATAAGVFVAASAGNSGPANTVAHISPWITSVAASTHDRKTVGDVTLGNGFTASTGFTVGLKNPVQDFYPVTAEAAKSARATNYSPIYRLPSGSKSLNFYYQIAKSVPGKTTVQMKIYTSSPDAASGNLKSSLFFAGHLFTPTSPDAGYKGSRSISSDNALDNGQYQAVLLVSGVPAASTAITVGP